MSKRLTDLVLSVAGLICLLPLWALIAVAIKLDSPGPVFFRQERVGRNFRRFRIWKFRTMACGIPGTAITGAADARVTRTGRWLRHGKLDETPQLLNVLAGEMSLVGPRPELPLYVAEFRREYEVLLRVRPGITDLASLRFSDEASLLRGPDPERIYRDEILLKKLRLSRRGLERSSWRGDLKLLWRTLCG